VREAFHAFKRKYGLHHEIIRQFIWRDFFAHLLYGYPDILRTGTYYPNYARIPWRTNKRALDAWKQGKTGVPVVDACMRQLNETGYMHNRGRMLVATFLIKTLLLDWREGERYFAQHLTDYDIASNNGNWLSIMGGGAYTMPYFRVMNPWIQSAKFDKDGVYIKQWVKELSDVEPKDLHRWADAYKKYKGIDYPKPIADYHEQKEVFLEMYRAVV
jgi:deoxyribodipyrimidine photo-lyase